MFSNIYIALKNENLKNTFFVCFWSLRSDRKTHVRIAFYI